MSKPTDLVQRGNRWYFKKRWPARYQFPGCKPVIMKSLQTSDYKLALAKLDDARAHAAAEFRAAFSTKAGTIQPTFPTITCPIAGEGAELSLSGARSLAQHYFSSAKRELDASPWLASDFEPDRRYLIREELAAQLAALDGTDGPTNRDYVASVETSVLRDAGVFAEPGSDAGRLLREYLRRAMVQLGILRLARFDGDFSKANSDALFGEIIGDTSGPATHRAISLKDAADEFLAQILIGGTTQKTKDRYRSELKHIVNFFGGNLMMRQLNASECDRFREAFSKLPPNFEDQLRKGVSFVEIISKFDKTGPVLAWGTQEKYLAQLSRFIKWASDHEYVTKNFADRLRPLAKKPAGSMAKLPFKAEELQRVFARPIYTGCVDDERGFAKPGAAIIRRSRYWAPLLGLFTGLRCGEILQLTPNHFKVSPAGNHFIVLTPDMQLKNDSAEREIPVHSTLQKIGLIDWVGRRRNQSDVRLFSDVPPDKNYNQPSSTFSKRFKSDLKYFGLGERRKKLTFHSFRHTFKSALDRADVSERKIDELCGWSRESKTGRRYGDGLAADVLKASVEAVFFDVDLRHLISHSTLVD